MINLKKALKKEKLSGVYLLNTNAPSSEIENLAAQMGLNFLYIDGSKITNKEGFFRVARVGLRFPDYCGNNWDAFSDCLGDLPGVPQDRGDIILYDDFHCFARGEPDNFQIALWAFQAAARERNDIAANLPLYVLLRGDRSFAPEVPVFDEA